MFAREERPTAHQSRPLHSGEAHPSLSEASLPARGHGLAKRIDIARFEEGTQEILALSRQLGRMQSRRGDQSRREALESRLGQELRNMSDLQRRYADLPGSLEEIKMKAFETGARERLAADSSAVNISTHLRGTAVSYRGILRELEGKSREELDLLRSAFEDRYGASLGATLEESFGRILGSPWGRAGRHPELKLSRLVNLLDGKRLEAAADGLALALRSKDASEAARICADLAAHPGDRSAASAIFEKAHARSFGAPDLSSAISRRFRGADRDLIEAASAGDTLGTQAITLERYITGKRPNLQDACQLLASKSPDELAALRDALRAHLGRDPIEVVAGLRIARPDARMDRLEALLRGDTVAAGAALVRAGMTKMDGEWVGEAFVGASAERREMLIAAYEKTYERSFWPDLKACVGKGTPFFLMARLVKNGALTPAELLRDCMHGLGTDEEGIKRVLAGKSGADVAAIEKEYAKFRGYTFLEEIYIRPLKAIKQIFETGSLKGDSQRPRDLRTDLSSELGGEDLRDVQCLLRGRPETLCDRFERLSSRHAYERGGFLHRVIDIFSREGSAIDSDLRSAREYHERFIKDRTPSPIEQKRFETLLGYLEHGIESFRATKNAVAYVGGNLVSCGTATVATLTALAMHESLLLAMGATAIGSLAGRVLTRWGLTAKGYGHEQFAADVALSIADGMTLAAGKVARVFGPIGRKIAASPIGKRVLRSAVSFTLKSVVKSAQSLEEGKVSKHLEYQMRAEEPERRKNDEFDLDDFLKRLSIYA